MEQDRSEDVIRETYRAQNVALAVYWPFFDRWAAQSQYGYVLGWAGTRGEAEAVALSHYRDRMHLILQ